MAGKARERDSKPSTPTDGAESRLAVEQMASPEDLKAYEDVAPGSAAKVMEVYMTESSHRRELELRRARAIQRRDYFGLTMVTVIALGVFGVSAWLINGAHTVPGTIFGVLGIVGAFLMLILRRART